jgi:hypothetical protein
MTSPGNVIKLRLDSGGVICLNYNQYNTTPTPAELYTLSSLVLNDYVYELFEK